MVSTYEFTGLVATVIIAITSVINLTEHEEHPFDQYTTMKHTVFLYSWKLCLTCYRLSHNIFLLFNNFYHILLALHTLHDITACLFPIQTAHPPHQALWTLQHAHTNVM